MGVLRDLPSARAQRRELEIRREVAQSKLEEATHDQALQEPIGLGETLTTTVVT
jgi:hypothetical protein